MAVTPGEAFDAPGFLRLSYATSLDILREGSRRMLEFAAAERLYDRRGRTTQAPRPLIVELIPDPWSLTSNP